MLVLESGEIVESADLLEIDGQLAKLVVLVAVGVRVLEGLDAQAVLRIHEEVPLEIVEHDRVLGRVVPDDFCCCRDKLISK